MNDFDYLAQLPGEGREQSWIQRRLETLDVREATVLAAAAQSDPPENTAQAINSGYTLTADESGYVARNNRPFIREYTQEPEPMEQSMG